MSKHHSLMQRVVDQPRGFTLLEILLVIAALGVLAGIVILAVNPTKQLGDARNSQRRSDVHSILNAVHQYTIDNNTLPSSINLNATCNTPVNEICKTGGACAGLTDFTVLTTDQKYLVSLPVDPLNSSADGTSYYVAKNNFGRVTVCAPLTEGSGGMITVTR